MVFDDFLQISIHHELEIPRPMCDVPSIHRELALPPPLAPAVLATFRRWYHNRVPLRLTSPQQQQQSQRWESFERMLVEHAADSALFRGERVHVAEFRVNQLPQ
jgi:hypothetical protein